MQYFCWSDSTIALQWINKPLLAHFCSFSTDLKIYVANRVKRIYQYTEPQRREHVRTEGSPADLISRGLSTKEMLNNELWLQGPKWLRQPQEQWPKPINWLATEIPDEAKMEFKVHTVQVKTTQFEVFVPGPNKRIPLLEYSHRLSKAVNILAYVKRFVDNFKQRATKNGTLTKRVNKQQKERMKNDDKFRTEFIQKYVPLPSETEKTSALKEII